MNAVREGVSCIVWLGLWRRIALSFRSSSLIVKVDKAPENADQNESDKRNPTGYMRRVKIGIAHRVPRVRQQSCGEKRDRNDDQHHWLNSIAMKSGHRPNETQDQRPREREMTFA